MSCLFFAQQEAYSDVTLACDGQFFAVHKLVLSVCSEYFEDILKKTSCTKPVIVLKDIKHNDLQALLNYMYAGEASVPQTDLSRLIKAAECLRIKGLAVPDESPPPNEKKRNSEEIAKTDEENALKKRKSDLHNSLTSHSSSDIERLSDSDADVLDVREIRAGTILQHGPFRSPALHTIEDNTTNGSPQPLAAQVILHHHQLQEHHITLRHHSLKHPSIQESRNSVHEETIVTHSMPEVRY